MKSKSTFLIISPRQGKNVARLADVLAVLSAAGWKTDTALKEFAGHTMELAKEAAEASYDLVIGYGGDGTLNQVVNGVMAAKRRRSIVGLIPGGTANVWAHEIGLPDHPVKASLLLINSEGRKVDLGHVGVDSLHLPSMKNEPPGKPSPPSGGRHHFLLMAGLGIDAAVMRRVSAPLKERIGQAAVALAAAKELPFQHAFPIEIASSVAGGERAVLWKGEALQVIVGNTRRYGNIAEVTGDAHIDDGLLDVGIITAGDALSTIQQVLAALLHREPVHGRSEYFRGRRFWISAPASVGLQLDGSRVKLKDYLAEPDRAALGETENPDAVLVTYRFEAMPRALRLAIPRAYDGVLFEGGAGKEGEPEDGVGGDTPGSEGGHQAEPVDALLEEGRKITVVAVGPNPERKAAWIVAGATPDKDTGESKPVAVRIDRDTRLATRDGESLAPAAAANLSEGSVIAVEGKRSKRGVIRAKRVVVVR
ncbi:MAG: diacylglycerol/lipid kinase family protein [Gemmatimonadales bacterium]